MKTILLALEILGCVIAMLCGDTLAEQNERVTSDHK